MSAARLPGSLDEPAPAPQFPGRPCAGHLEMLLAEPQSPLQGLSVLGLSWSLIRAFIFELTYLFFHVLCDLYFYLFKKLC